jgi:calcium channel MID1
MWWLQERNMMQPFQNGTSLPTNLLEFANNTQYLSSSRNPSIDVTVQPGPYKEILPCEGLCYNIVQSCPAALNFGCPQPGNIAFNQSYGIMPNVAKHPEQNGQLTCNYPGATHLFLSRGSKIPTPNAKAFVALAVMSLMFI